jgi:predicted small integral membrane protein
MAMGLPADGSAGRGRRRHRSALLPEVRADGRALRPDVVGAVLVTAALVAILFALTHVERSGIAAAVTIAPLAAGVALLVAFAAWERRAPAPLMRFEILRVRSLRAASLGAGINAVAFTSIVYIATVLRRRPRRRAIPPAIAPPSWSPRCSPDWDSPWPG